MIVEDFHYLSLVTKKTIFQQWKNFVDEEISVIVVGTTHHAVDLAFSNRDLVGRIRHLELSTWRVEDLKRIVSQGFKYLGIPVNSQVEELIARESAGLPIITQATCLRMFLNKGIETFERGKVSIDLTQKDAYLGLHLVAMNNYGQLGTIYPNLKAGPRKKARKYNTYEIVISAFSENPIEFSLHIHDIQERIERMPIPKEQKPPSQSIKSMLKALGKFQEKLEIELFEWMPKEEKLYILEPSFLFYLRWRQYRERPITIRELLREWVGRLQ